MTGEARLDRDRVERLAMRLMVQITPELSRFPPQPDNVFVVLNAIAFAAATIIAGTGPDGHRFFEKAVTENIGVVKHAEETGLLRPKVVGHA